MLPKLLASIGFIIDVGFGLKNIYDRYRRSKALNERNSLREKINKSIVEKDPRKAARLHKEAVAALHEYFRKYDRILSSDD